jgi:hypothetical protein
VSLVFRHLRTLQVASGKWQVAGEELPLATYNLPLATSGGENFMTLSVFYIKIDYNTGLGSYVINVLPETQC